MMSLVVESESGEYEPVDIVSTVEEARELAECDMRHRMRDVKRQQIATDVACETCGAPMVIKWGKHGEFLACSAYPKCRTTKEFKRDEAGEMTMFTRRLDVAALLAEA